MAQILNKKRIMSISWNVQSWKNLFDWKQVLSDQRKTVVGTALSIPEYNNNLQGNAWQYTFCATRYSEWSKLMG
jgi:hypothetical protein